VADVTPRNVVLLAAATVVVGSLAFAAGRQTRSSAGSIAVRDTAEASSGGVHADSAAAAQAEARDLSKVTVENLAQVEFEQAYELLRSAPPETLTGWAKRLEAMPTSPRKSAAIAAFYKALAQVDTKQAVDLVLQIRGRDARTIAASAVEATAPPTSGAEVARMLLMIDQFGGSLPLLLSSWSEADPVSASAFAEAHLHKVEPYAIGTLLNNWAAVDPLAAPQWLERLAPSHRDATVYRDFYSGWLEHDQAAAVQHLVAHSSDEQLAGAAAEAAGALFRESAAVAYAFITDVENTALKVSAINAIAGGAGGRVEGGAPVDRVARWLFTLPHELVGPQLGALVTVWRETDPAAVASWIGEMSQQKRDWVAANVCLQARSYPPGRYLEAGLAIHDPQLRAETLRAALQQIGTPKKAQKVVRRLNLAPPAAAELERIIAEL
jgi:hypothetical protein